MANQKHILVYIARHGTTDLNKKDSFRGPIDAPLDKSGIADANALATLFEPIELSYIFHSDKKRTRMTAETVARRKHMETIANPDFQAWNVGMLAGQPKNEENLQIIEYYIRNPEKAIPEGESLNVFKNRVRPLIGEAIDLALECGVPVLIVAHSSVVHEVGSVLANDTQHTLVEPGGVCAIYVQNGKLDAEPIFKPREKAQRSGDVVT